MANPSQVTMDGQLKEILASMQKEIAEIRGEDESVRGEIERITNENESLHRDNERIDYDLAVIRKDLDAARVQHTQDFEALREVSHPFLRSPTLTAISPGHHVTSSLASSRPTRPCSQKGFGTPWPRWEGLRDSRSVYHLSNTNRILLR